MTLFNFFDGSCFLCLLLTFPSVINALHKPRSTTELAINAIEDWLKLPCTRISFFQIFCPLPTAHCPLTPGFDSHIPFIPPPGIRAPPLSRRAPGAGHTNYFSMDTFVFIPGANLSRTSSFRLHQCAQRRPKYSEPQRRFRIADFGLRIAVYCLLFTICSSSLFLFQLKPLYAKGIRAMRIEQLRRTNILRSHQLCQARQHQFQLLGLRRERNKQSRLLYPRLHRFTIYRDAHNRGGRWMHFPVEQQ